MIVKVTSHRGHHEAVVDEAVGKQIFEKATGLVDAPLPESLKEKVPETFQELESLWKPGKAGYSAIFLDESGEMVSGKQYNPAARDMVLIAPVVAG